MGGLRFVALLLGEQLLGPLASGCKGAVALHVRIEHFQAPLQASTSSSWARSGNPSRTRNRSSFQGPRRIFTLPARHCELNGPNLVSLSPLSIAGRYGEATERAHQGGVPGSSRPVPDPCRNRYGPACRPVRPSRAAISRRRPGSPARAIGGKPNQGHPSLIWQKTSLICRFNSLIRPN